MTWINKVFFSCSAKICAKIISMCLYNLLENTELSEKGGLVINVRIILVYTKTNKNVEQHIAELRFIIHLSAILLFYEKALNSRNRQHPEFRFGIYRFLRYVISQIWFTHCPKEKNNRTKLTRIAIKLRDIFSFNKCRIVFLNHVNFLFCKVSTSYTSFTDRDHLVKCTVPSKYWLSK